MSKKHLRPQYVEDFRRPEGTLIIKDRSRYTLWTGHYKYNPVGGRSDRVKETYLGMITESGFRPKKWPLGVMPPDDIMKLYTQIEENARLAAEHDTAPGEQADDENDTEDEAPIIGGSLPVDTDPRGTAAAANEAHSDLPAGTDISIGRAPSADPAEPGRLPAVPGSWVLVPSVEFGASACFFIRFQWLRKLLGEFFSGKADVMYAVAILWAVRNDPLHRLQARYRDSILPEVMPGLAMSSASMSRLIQFLGDEEEDRTDFLRALERELDKRVTDAWADGHRMLTEAKDMALAQIGHNSKTEFARQVNVVHIAGGDGTGHLVLPLNYEVAAGNENDVAVLPGMKASFALLQAGTWVIGDKGCYSAAICRMLEGLGLKTCFALRRGNAFVNGRIPAPGQYPAHFRFRNRVIEAQRFTTDKDGKALADCEIVLCRDQKLFDMEKRHLEEKVKKENEKRARKRALLQEQLDEIRAAIHVLEELKTYVAAASEEAARCVRTVRTLTLEEGKRQAQFEANAALDPNEQIAAQPEMGTITLRISDKGVSCETGYGLYKSRIGVEDGFKFEDDTLGLTGSYMRTDTRFAGWMLLAHIASVMGLETLHMLDERGVSDTISYDDFREYLSSLRVSYSDGHHPADSGMNLAKSTCEKVGISMEDLYAMNPV